jgi:hypothetical protein
MKSCDKCIYHTVLNEEQNDEGIVCGHTGYPIVENFAISENCEYYESEDDDDEENTDC